MYYGHKKEPGGAGVAPKPTLYRARPNPVEQPSHRVWWGSGGAELFDELDPKCLTEPVGLGGDELPGLAVFSATSFAATTAAEFTLEQIENWRARARGIPGWTDRDPPIQIVPA